MHMAPDNSAAFASKTASRSRAVAIPVHSRFLEPDPIGYQGGINFYGYTENDPVNAADPTGLVVDAPIVVCSGFGSWWNGSSCVSLFGGSSGVGVGGGPTFAVPPGVPVSGGGGVVAATSTTKAPKIQCPPGAQDKYPVPPGYHSYGDNTGRLIAINGTNTPLMNPAYQRVVDAFRPNWRGIFRDFDELVANIAKALIYGKAEEMGVESVGGSQSAQQAVEAGDGAKGVVDAATETNSELNSQCKSRNGQ